MLKTRVLGESWLKVQHLVSTCTLNFITSARCTRVLGTQVQGPWKYRLDAYDESAGWKNRLSTYPIPPLVRISEVHDTFTQVFTLASLRALSRWGVF